MRTDLVGPPPRVPGAIQVRHNSLSGPTLTRQLTSVIPNPAGTPQSCSGSMQHLRTDLVPKVQNSGLVRDVVCDASWSTAGG